MEILQKVHGFCGYIIVIKINVQWLHKEMTIKQVINNPCQGVPLYFAIHSNMY